MEAGETPRGGPGFIPWQPGVPETMSRIIYLWDHLRDHLGGQALLPEISEICYLRNTDLGNEIGELLLTLGYTEAFEQGRIPLKPQPSSDS
jgi:hypothetical protein